MKKLLSTAAMLLVLAGGIALFTACGDDDRAGKTVGGGGTTPGKSDTYAHYSLEVGSDLSHFYHVVITYMSLDGIEHTDTLDRGQTEWSFDATTELDVPAFKCYIECTARDDFDPGYATSDYFDFGYAYKCTAYSPTVGIKVSQNEYTNSVEVNKIYTFMQQNPVRLILDFPEEWS